MLFVILSQRRRRNTTIQKLTVLKEFCASTISQDQVVHVHLVHPSSDVSELIPIFDSIPAKMEEIYSRYRKMSQPRVQFSFAGTKSN